jgi:hypothetical protein
MAAVVKTNKDLPIEEWPEIDGYDCRPREPMSQEYLDAVTPEHVKTALALRKAAKDTQTR